MLCHSSAGTPFIREIFVGMPKLNPDYLHPVFYLYADEEHAREDRDPQGTGFIVSVPTAVEHRFFLYLITAWHVVFNGKGAPVVRIVQEDGRPDIFPYDLNDWQCLPEYDITAISLSPKRDFYNIVAIPEKLFLTEKKRDDWKIGIGDDVFMVGLFGSDSREPKISTPSARFGHISIEPVPVRQKNNQVADLYCLDMNSRSGYSGSPVFVYRLPFHNLQDQAPLEQQRYHFALLGVHCGQFPERWEMTPQGGLKNAIPSAEDRSLYTHENYIKGLSGMTTVVPAWNISEVLNLPKFKEQRDREKVQLENSREYWSTPIAEDIEKS